MQRVESAGGGLEESAARSQRPPRVEALSFAGEGVPGVDRLNGAARRRMVGLEGFGRLDRHVDFDRDAVGIRSLGMGGSGWLSGWVSRSGLSRNQTPSSGTRQSLVGTRVFEQFAGYVDHVHDGGRVAAERCMEHDGLEKLRAHLAGIAGGSCALPFDRLRELTGRVLPEGAASAGWTDPGGWHAWPASGVCRGEGWRLESVHASARLVRLERTRGAASSGEA